MWCSFCFVFITVKRVADENFDNEINTGLLFCQKGSDISNTKLGVST